MRCLVKIIVVVEQVLLFLGKNEHYNGMADI